MQVHGIDIQTAGGIRPLSLNKGRTRLHYKKENDETAELRKQNKNAHFAISYDGYNVIVTDLASPDPLSIEGQPLPIEKPSVWLRGQELRIEGVCALYWDGELQAAEAYQERSRRLPSANLGMLLRPRAWGSILSSFVGMRLLAPIQRFSPFVAVIAMGLVLSLLTSLFYFGGRTGDAISQGILVPTQSVPEASSAAAVITPTELPVALARERAASPPTIVFATIQADVFVTPTPTIGMDELTAVAATGDGGEVQEATPLPCQTTTPQPIEWDERLDRLEVKLEAACVPPGGEYWRLDVARWIDPQESKGRHLVYADATVEDGIRAYGNSFVMSWGDGECRRYIRGIDEPFGHGENCPMFAAGSAYSVWMEGLPSDTIRGIGLGSIDDRGFHVQTSFYFKFTKATYTQ